MGAAFPVCARDFCLLSSTQIGSLSIQSLTPRMPESLRPGVKRAGRATDQSSPPSAEVKYAWIYASTLHMISLFGAQLHT